MKWTALALAWIQATSLAVASGADVGPQFGPATVLLDQQPAPAPGMAWCGLVLVAHQRGPQLLISHEPASCVAALVRGEKFHLTVPVRGLSDKVKLTAEITSRGQAKTRAALAGAKVEIDAWAESADAVVTFRKVRLHAGGRTFDVPLAPPVPPEGAGPPRTLPPLRKALELALIEWDWRMQDGIETPRLPSGYAEAIRRTFERGDRLLADLRAADVELGDLPGRWQGLRQRAQSDGQSEDLWREVHRLRRQLVLANPLARTGPIAFIKQVPGMFSHQLTQYYGSCSRPGGGLFVLQRPGESMECRSLVGDRLPMGSYQHVEVSCEGDRVLFAYCPVTKTPRNREEHPDHFFHLYEVRADGSSLRQLTAGPYDDFSPRLLPDGKILFISTRRGGFHRCGRGPCQVYTLSIAEADGSNPRPISYHETHEWDPSVLDDGRVVYTRWDYVDRNAVHYQQLWSVRPDGSDVRIFYGNNTWNPVGVWEARGVPGSHRVMATAAAHHGMTAGSIILLDRTHGVDGLEPITRLTPDALFPESEAPMSNGVKGFWHAPVGVKTPPAVPPEAQRWPGHCYRSPWPLSERYFLAAYSFDHLIGEPSGNIANMFGIYMVDCFGNKELLYRDLNIASLWPVPLAARPRPKMVPSMIAGNGRGEGRFFLQNVYAGWPSLPKDPIKRLRIVQVLPKSTPHANTPTVGVANGSPGKQVLGTVPVETDGSAYFRAPAGIPLAFQALDDRGQAVQIMRSLTYLQPGETASCVGCHEPRTTAPSLARTVLAIAREPSAIAPGPDGSRPLSYPILVQPVLDRKCVSCHNRQKPEGKVLLTGEPEGRYTVSYNAMVKLVSVSAWWGNSAPNLYKNREPLTLPDQFGARGSKIMQTLLAGHEDVVLTAEEIERLATWMDVNALFYGTFDTADQARQQRGQRIPGPSLE